MKKTVSLPSVFLFVPLVLLFSLFSCRKYGNGISSSEKNKAITNPQVVLDITLAKRYFKLLKKDRQAMK